LIAKILLIIKLILKRMFKKKSNMFLFLILPVITSTFLLTLYTSSSGGTVTFALDDRSNSASSNQLIAEIEKIGKYNIVEKSEEEIKQAISKSHYSFGLVISDDFEKDILAGNKPSIFIISLAESEGAAWVKVTSDFQVKNMIDLSKSVSGNKEVYYNLLKQASESGYSFLTKELEDESIEREASQQAIGMFLMLIMLSSFGTAGLIFRERSLGTLSRISIAPDCRSAYVYANVITSFVILILQIFLVLGASKFIVNIDFHTSLLNLFIIIFVYGFATVSMGMMFVQVAKNARNFGSINALVLTPTSMIAGCFWPVTFMPDFLIKLGYLTPQRWALVAIQNAQSHQSFMGSLGVLTGFGVLMIFIAIYFANNKSLTR